MGNKAHRVVRVMEVEGGERETQNHGCVWRAPFVHLSLLGTLVGIMHRSLMW